VLLENQIHHKHKCYTSGAQAHAFFGFEPLRKVMEGEDEQPLLCLRIFCWNIPR
jgi:hypothetical protein